VALTAQSDGLASKVTGELLTGSSPIGLWRRFSSAQPNRTLQEPSRRLLLGGEWRLPAVFTLCSPNCASFPWERCCSLEPPPIGIAGRADQAPAFWPGLDN